MQVGLPIPVVLDGRGILVNPDFHDGYLTGVGLPDERTVCLDLDEEDQEKRWRLRIPDVTQLRADHFWQGNIIFEVGVVWKKAIDEQLLAALMMPSANGNRAERLTQEILSGEKTVLFVTPSLGCELILLSDATPAQFMLERR